MAGVTILLQEQMTIWLQALLIPILFYFKLTRAKYRFGHCSCTVCLENTFLAPLEHGESTFFQEKRGLTVDSLWTKCAQMANSGPLVSD